MKILSKIVIILVLACLMVPNGLLAQESMKNEFNPITTGVTSLGIAPDARGASMGDLGAATDQIGRAHV